MRDAVLRAFRAVPFKPIGHEYHLEKTRKKRRPKVTQKSEVDKV